MPGPGPTPVSVTPLTFFAPGGPPAEIWGTTASMPSATSVPDASEYHQTDGSQLTLQTENGAWVNQTPGSVASGQVRTAPGTDTVTTADRVLLLDATSGGFNETLFTAVGFGGILFLKATTAGSNLVTVAAPGGQTIEGAATVQLGTIASGASWSALTLVSDGTNWRIIDGAVNTLPSITTAMLAAGGFGSTAGQNIMPPLLGTVASVATGATNNIYLFQVDVPFPRTLTGVLYYVGATSNGNVQSVIYNAAGTSKLASSASTAQGTASLIQQVAFSAPLAVTAGTYHFGLVFSSATATYSGANFSMCPAVAAASTLPAPTTITPGTFQAIHLSSLPVMALY